MINICRIFWMHRHQHHFFFAFLRRRPNGEGRGRLAFPHSRREELFPDPAALERSADSSLSRRVAELGPAAEISSGCPFPSPSRWAWKVEVCCSRQVKLSCTLSNCRQRPSQNPTGFLLCSVGGAYLLDVGLQEELGPDRLAAAVHLVADVGVAPGQLLRRRTERFRRAGSEMVLTARRGADLQQLRALLQLDLAWTKLVLVVIQNRKQSLCRRAETTMNKVRPGEPTGSNLAAGCSFFLFHIFVLCNYYLYFLFVDFGCCRLPPPELNKKMV